MQNIGLSMESLTISGKGTRTEFIKFALVGVLNTFIHLAILFVLTEYFNFYYVFASLIGFIIAVTNSFILNTVWTFKKDIKYKTSFRYGKFFIISITAIFINLSLLYLITEIFGIWYILSQVISTSFSLIINFLGNKFWTYK